MGWWSEDVMGGDRPCDYALDFQDIAGIDWKSVASDDMAYGFTQEHIDTHMTEIMKKIKGKKWIDTKCIMYQVIGYICVKGGFKVYKTHRDLIARHCYDPELDEWGSEGSHSRRNRYQKLEALKKQVKELETK